MIAFVPIPFDRVFDCTGVWWPFAERIAKDSGYTVEQLAERIFSGEVQPLIAWSVEQKKAVAFGGLRVFDRGADKIAEIIWMTGDDKDKWTHLLPDVESYARHIGCAGMRMFARRGWKPFLTKNGYSETHTILDKEF